MSRRRLARHLPDPSRPGATVCGNVDGDAARLTRECVTCRRWLKVREIQAEYKAHLKTEWEKARAFALTIACPECRAPRDSVCVNVIPLLNRYRRRSAYGLHLIRLEAARKRARFEGRAIQA